MTKGSTPLEARPRTRGLAVPVAVALVFLLAHLPFLASTLEDLDSVNFALGVREFDPYEHRPHPPGYPIYIALGKLSTAAFDLLHPAGAAGAARSTPAPGPGEGRDQVADNGAMGLALWSALFGAIAVFPLGRFFSHVDGDDSSAATAAVALAIACPLFWFTAVRPLSDVPGFAAALAAQAILAGAIVAGRSAARRAAEASSHGAPDTTALVASGRLIIAGAFVSALAIGMRSQAIWLTLPLVAVAILDRVGRDAGRVILGSTVACAAGTALWAVPLVIATGGVSRYLGALAKQGGEDFSGVDMLWTNPTPRRFVMGLLDTFVTPWGSAVLAVVVIALASVGFLVLARRRPIAIVVLAAAFLPYAVFHLLFQETVTTRYALPLVPPMAYLAVRGASALTGRYRMIITGALAAASLVIVLGPVARYGREGSPVSRMFADIRRHGGSEGNSAVLGLHRRVVSETRRSFLWELGGKTYWSHVLPSPVRHEWLELVKYWAEGGDRPVWFLAEPLRTDLALVDPASRRLMSAYRWPFPVGPFVGGVRPSDIDWYEFRPPGWFLGEGWALTPETAGVAQGDGKGPNHGPIEAWIRRRPGATTLVVGGRNLGGPNDPVTRIDVTLDGRTLDSTTVKPAPGFFLRLLSLPEGSLAGAGRYARLTVSAAPAASGPAGPAAIEQFDLQDDNLVVFGFDEGWHELEYNRITGRLWRWSSESATLRIHSAGRDLSLRVIGESPLDDFSRASQITVRAGSVALARREASTAFSFDVVVPATVLDQAGGIVTLETDQTFVPDERMHNGDKRRLGLRVYGVTIRAARDLSAR